MYWQLRCRTNPQSESGKNRDWVRSYERELTTFGMVAPRKMSNRLIRTVVYHFLSTIRQSGLHYRRGHRPELSKTEWMGSRKVGLVKV